MNRVRSSGHFRQLQAAITANEVVLIGFGVEPGYLLNSLEQMRSLHRKPPLAIVSKKSAVEFIRSSPRLAAVCDLEGAGRLIQMDACEALGELMRIRHLSVTRQIVAGGFERASALNFPDSEVQERARQALERILLDRPLRSLLRLAWQAAALGSESPQDVGIPVMKRFVEDWADIAGMLIVLASCSDIADLGAHSDGLRVQTEDGSLVDLWPLLPLRRQNAARICGLVPGNTHRFSGPSDADVPMVLLSAGAWGKPVLGRSSLIGNRSSSSLINSMREPVDAVNFQDLQERVMSLSGQHPTLADLLKV